MRVSANSLASFSVQVARDGKNSTTAQGRSPSSLRSSCRAQVQAYSRCPARIGAQGTRCFLAKPPSRLLTVPPVVVLGACVLYPAAQRDLFMWLAAGGAIHAHWTNEIHEEWIRNVEHDYGIARSDLEQIAKLMN